MPFGDCTGPWWMNPGESRALSYGCYGRGMRFGRGNAARQRFMAKGYAGYGPSGWPTPAEEKSYLEDVARRLEEELLFVREKIEKLQSSA